jgi:hypothetical protein
MNAQPEHQSATARLLFAACLIMPGGLAWGQAAPPAPPPTSRPQPLALHQRPPPKPRLHHLSRGKPAPRSHLAKPAPSRSPPALLFLAPRA